MATANVVSVPLVDHENDPQPLSWSYARARLRHILQKFVEDQGSPPATTARTTVASDRLQSEQQQAFVAWAERHNIDIHAGSILFSVSLLILASCALASAKGSSVGSALNAQAQIPVYRSQVAAAALLLLGSLTSLWIVRRSANLRNDDTNQAKKRQIQKFLRQVRLLESVVGSAGSNNENEDWATSVHPNNLPTNLSETAQCDIFPVYRKLSQEHPRCLWTRLPSLLLVEGDYVALQIGDTCPADCCSLDKNEARLRAGEVITLEALGETEADLMAELPRGRTTLPYCSERLLLLCNNMRVFRVETAPIQDFIHRPAMPKKPSQIWRQIKAIRIVLMTLAPSFLVLTAAIVLVRPDATQNDLSLSLPLPFLAALGVSPLVAPTFVFLLEVFGTARILRSVHPHAVANESNPTKDPKSQSCLPPNSILLLLRYIWAVTLTRLSMWSLADAVWRWFQKSSVPKNNPRTKLVRVPPASLNLLEKLGVCTAFALVDDELAYELNAVPQQLLIPSGHGLKLLDMCPVYDDDEISAGSDSGSLPAGRGRGRSFDEDSDSESEEEGLQRFHSTLRQKFVLKRRVLRRRNGKKQAKSDSDDNDDATDSSDESDIEVQFEDPAWWQHLPALKCIGLSCLVNEAKKAEDSNRQLERLDMVAHSASGSIKGAKEALVHLVTEERRSRQLSALAECIGFSQDPNSNGEKGDLTPFEEQLRFHVLSKSLFQQRLALDSHERSSEQSRWWGHVRADSTSVIVKDKRTGAYQLLTVGDPHVVASLCSEAWQGEISTILPLGQIDRQTILETSKNWKLADLDVAAFGYSPVPHSLEKRLKEETRHSSQVFLLDASTSQNQSILKDKTISRDWMLIRNQVFLGVLGSLVVPRREVPKLLAVLDRSGVRFVYFSPRNMRRQKEIASQMGIDVAWNCAISLRPLEVGEEDPHRMVSAYADWDVNAKLPHGVEEVRQHLKEVDNVPLLVSLFTDTTKHRTTEMIETFQTYHDTVLAVGIAHLPQNNQIFAVADIAIGIDVLAEGKKANVSSHLNRTAASSPADQMMAAELDFVSAIASHSCAFRFRGVSSLSHLSSLIEQARTALASANSSGVFLLSSSISFSFYVIFAACAASTTLPHVPAIGAVVYLQILLPLVGLSMAMTDSGEKTMKEVPPKNDSSQTFAQKEGFLLFQMVVLKALMVAVPPQILHLIAFGELVIKFEPQLIQSQCGGGSQWYDVIRCDALRDYSGPARISAGIAVFSVFVMTSLASSITFVSRFEPILAQPPWEYNRAWVVSVCCGAVLTGVVAALATDDGTGSGLPWYWYVISVSLPFICIVWNEYCKKVEAKREIRAEKLRRLQFETRLGAWSPK